MSIFRNLMINAVDSLKRIRIVFSHIKKARP